MRKMDKQTFWAGMAGTVALIAILCELIFGGISTTSVSAAIKDLMGIAIDVMVFLIAIKLSAKPNRTEPLETKLQNALNQWRNEHANMIICDDEYDKSKFWCSFSMKTDLKNFFGDATALSKPGWFMRIPKPENSNFPVNSFKIIFHLNVSTFLEGKNVSNRKDAFETIAKDIALYLQAKTNVTIDNISISDKEATITVITNNFSTAEENNITIDDQIQNFITIIDTAYTCYLVAGNFKL